MRITYPKLFTSFDEATRKILTSLYNMKTHWNVEVT